MLTIDLTDNQGIAEQIGFEHLLEEVLLAPIHKIYNDVETNIRRLILDRLGFQLELNGMGISTRRQK